MTRGFIDPGDSFAQQDGEGFTWRKETFFGGLYQETVARRPA
jgi:hypothetical protein